MTPPTDQHPVNLLDKPVSIFANAYQTQLEGITTLRCMVTTHENRGIIDAIRNELDEGRQKERKKQLRAFSPVALLNHRMKDYPITEQVDQQWPMLAADVDAKDNPGVNMTALKKYIARLTYVLLCSYSVRGGLWFVVRLPDYQTPDTLAAHFRYLQRLFSQKFGITLDVSKGGNPTHLRYISFDADPYLNEAPTIMAKTYTLTQPKSKPVTFTQSSYGRSKKDIVCRLVHFAQSATEGNRHNTLLKAAIVARGYIAANQVDEQTIVGALENIASEWPEFQKSKKTIADGVRYGLRKPIETDTVPHPASRLLS